MSLDTVSMIDVDSGLKVGIGVVTIGGVKVPAHIFVDSAGTVTGTAVNPFRTAPAIIAAGFTPCGGTVASAGAIVLDLPPDTTRKGGWIRAKNTNAGLITVTLKKTVAGSPVVFATDLGSGDAFPFTVNPGYVVQDEITVSGNHVGDAFEGVVFA